MTPLTVTPFSLAQRFVGVKEAPGAASNPMIQAMLGLDLGTVMGDDVAWCSAFANYIAWLLRLPRSKSLAARSWLRVGTVVPSLKDAVPGFDVVILKRGEGDQPGPDVIAAPGHVGFFAGYEAGRLEPASEGAPFTMKIGEGRVHLLAGNQGDMVSVATFPESRVLGVRRLEMPA